jgi:hypothetical protein
MKTLSVFVGSLLLSAAAFAQSSSVALTFDDLPAVGTRHAAILAFLKAHHYETATCTIDNEDYVFAEAYSKMLARHDDAFASHLRQAYVDYTAAEIDYYTQLHKQIFGREIPHVMVLQASRLNADTIDQVLDIFTVRHYRFISVAQAQSDSAYATPDTFATKYGPMWSYRWAKELGIRVDGSKETEPPVWVSKYGNE